MTIIQLQIFDRLKAIYVSLNNNFTSSPGNMATSLRKYFRKTNKEKKVRKRPRRSFYNFLCGGGVKEEDIDTGEIPIEKARKEESEDMGVAESKKISAVSASIIEVAGNDEPLAKEKSDTLEDKKKREHDSVEMGFDEVDKGTPIEADEGTDIDARKETIDNEVKYENGNKDEHKNVENLDESSFQTTESVSEDINKDETKKKENEKDDDGSETKDEDIQRKDSTSSSSDSDSSNYTSCEEDKIVVCNENKSDKIEGKQKKKSKKTKLKKSNSSKKAKTPSESETQKEKDNDKKDMKLEIQEDKKETPIQLKKKSGKNPLVRMQSKILDALSHQNFDSYTPAICIDFLKSPNLKLLSSLNKKLKHNNADWNEEFLELHGSDVLLDIVDALGYKRVTKLSDALLLLESVECVKTIMNSKMGLDYLVQHGDYLKKLVKGE